MKNAFRKLSNKELELVSGGDIVVTGDRPGGGWPWWDWGSGYGDDGDDYGGGGGGGGDADDTPEIVVTPPPTEPDKCEANPVTIIFDGLSYPGTDGADYYLPEDVTIQDIIDAWNHIVSINNDGNPLSAFGEIWEMYQNTDHPHHVDFKDYPAGDISYTSNATGETVATSPFEAFGNFFFGAIMTAAGFSLEATQIIAGAVQNLSGSASAAEAIAAAAEALLSGEFGDDPRDAPHVEFGANAAAQFILSGNGGVSFMRLTVDTCSSGGGSTGGGSTGGSSGAGSGGVDFGGGWSGGGGNTYIP